MIGKTEAQLTAEGVSYEVRGSPTTASSIGNPPHYVQKHGSAAYYMLYQLIESLFSGYAAF